MVCQPVIEPAALTFKCVLGFRCSWLSCPRWLQLVIFCEAAGRAVFLFVALIVVLIDREWRDDSNGCHIVFWSNLTPNRVSTHQILTPNSVPFGSNSEGWGQIPKVKFRTFFKFRGKVQNLNSEPLGQILEVFMWRGGRAPIESSRRSNFGVKICFMCPRIKFWPQNLTSKSDPEGT